jgi:formylglycine-generating enzyme required for sulfatase activity
MIMKCEFVSIVVCLLTTNLVLRAEAPRQSVNSIGIALVPIAAGSFEMGVDSVPLPPELTKGLRGVSWDRPDGNGDYDEVPVHNVTITQPLLIGQTEVTIEQFRRPTHPESAGMMRRRSVNGSVKRKASRIASQPKRNGSMPAARGRARHFRRGTSRMAWVSRIPGA